MAITMSDDTASTRVRSPLVAALNAYGNDQRLSIMKGTIPGEIDDFDIANYSADVLATFSGPTIIDLGIIGVNVVMGAATSEFVNATATGTATWWVMHHATLTDSLGLMGDCTDEVGTGTLKIDDTSVVSGNPVTIQGFSFSLIKTP